jgi:hypothetical protein
VKRLNLGVNVLAVKREPVGDVNQLAHDDPADAASNRDRNQGSRENGHDAADVQPLKKTHDRSQ